MKTANRRREESTKEFKWKRSKALNRRDKRKRMLKHTNSFFQTARHREIAYKKKVTLLFQVADFSVKWFYALLFFWLSFRLKMCLHLSDVFQIASFVVFINQASQNIPTKRLVDGEKESRLVQQETNHKPHHQSRLVKPSAQKHPFCPIVTLSSYNLRRRLIMRCLFGGGANFRAACSLI